MVSYIYSRTLDTLKTNFWRIFGVSMFFAFVAGIATSIGVLPIITMPIAYVLDATLRGVMLRKYRTGEDPKCKDAFKYFGGGEKWQSFLHIAGGCGWKDLWILIWCLIPVVGPIFAIIRSYEYAFVPSILTDRPEVGAMEARDLSKQLTTGYKGKMFLCHLVYFGGGYLVLMLLMVLATRVRFFAFIYLLFFMAFLLFGIVLMDMLNAVLYEEISTMTEEKYMSIVQKPVRPQYQQQPPQQYQQQPQATKICPNCGAAVDVNAQFCPNCGTKC